MIDLRNNPGGLLDQAISVSDAFLEKGEIVSTRGRNAEETQRFNARPGDLTKGKPVIVVIKAGWRRSSSPARCSTSVRDAGRTRWFAQRLGADHRHRLGALGNAAWLSTPLPRPGPLIGKAITPDIEVLQDVPVDRSRGPTEGEASLRGHLKAEGAENPARSPTCRRMRRTIVPSKRRSICYAARSPMLRSRLMREGRGSELSGCFLIRSGGDAPRFSDGGEG